MSEERSHKFFMTTYYAVDEPLILCCSNLEDMYRLKQQAAQDLFYGLNPDEKDPKRRLGLNTEMREALHDSDISTVKADALIFQGISEHNIAVLGASGDAHPIMMFDEQTQIGCYIAGSHAALSKGVLERSFDKMVELGGNPQKIKLFIGPGLGPNSYEFGENAPEYFGIPSAVKKVQDSAGKPKCLVDIEKLVIGKLENRLPKENIVNTSLDTMGFDLYDEINIDGVKTMQRKINIDFVELKESGPLFFGARREVMTMHDSIRAENSGAFSKVGRHAAGFSLHNYLHTLWGESKSSGERRGIIVDEDKERKATSSPIAFPTTIEYK